MNYKKISFKEALVLHTEGKDVYYTYHTSPDNYRYIGSLGLDHARRNTSWYLYFTRWGKKMKFENIDTFEDEQFNINTMQTVKIAKILELLEIHTRVAQNIERIEINTKVFYHPEKIRSDT